MNVQKDGLKKNFWDSHKFPQAHKKACDENERNKQRKNNTHVKMFLLEGRTGYGKVMGLIFISMTLDTMKWSQMGIIKLAMAGT